MTSKKLRYATTHSPEIQAILGKTFRFPDEFAAREKIESLTTRFFRSRHALELSEGKQIVFWIKGFEVTKEEEKQRYVGNYALISARPADDTHWTITASKLPADIKFHPQKKRPKARNPNWTHPIIRAAKRGQAYSTIEKARAELEELHKEYPQTTIPAPPKLYVMIYARNESGKALLEKHVMEVVPLEIGYKLALYPKQDEVPEHERATADALEPVGKFSQQVALKKKL